MISIKYKSFIFIFAFVYIYVGFAIIETISVSFETVDKAFENFIKKEFEIESLSDDRIGGKAICNIENAKYVFVPFEIDNNFSVVSFENGWFGWKLKSATFNINNSTVSKIENFGDKEVIYGPIPEHILNETHTVRVNDTFAKTIKLKEIGMWLIINKDTENRYVSNKTNIRFLDNNKDVIEER